MRKKGFAKVRQKRADFANAWQTARRGRPVPPPDFAKAWQKRGIFAKDWQMQDQGKSWKIGGFSLILRDGRAAGRGRTRFRMRGTRAPGPTARRRRLAPPTDRPAGGGFRERDGRELGKMRARQAGPSRWRDGGKGWVRAEKRGMSVRREAGAGGQRWPRRMAAARRRKRGRGRGRARSSNQVTEGLRRRRAWRARKEPGARR